MDGGGARGDCLVVFDRTYGSLRLTERLYHNFDVILQRLRVSAEAEKGREHDELLLIVEKLNSAYYGFQKDQNFGQNAEEENVPTGCMHVFTNEDNHYYL